MSATLNALELKKKRIEEGLPTYNFGLGENPMRVPKLLKDELIKSADIKNYESIDGTEEVKNIIRMKYSNKNYHFSDVIFGNGSKELLFMMQLIFDGIIIIISPYWVSYIEHSKMLNKKYEIIETNIKENYKLLPKQLEKVCRKYKDENKLLIFNSPNNPTGIVYNDKELKNLSDIINEYNVIVYADELYNELYFKSRYAPSISYYCPRLTIRSFSLSKIYGLGGWRCGWCTFPLELKYLYNKMRICGVSIYTCITTPLLNVVIKALDKNVELEKHIDKTRNIFNIVMNYTYNRLTNETQLMIVKPESAWYIFLNFDFYRFKLIEKNINNSIELVDSLIKKKGIICVPGQKFGLNNYTVRLSCIEINKDKLDESFYIWANKIVIGITTLIEFINEL